MHPQIIDNVIHALRRDNPEELFSLLLQMGRSEDTSTLTAVYDGASKVCQSLWLLGRNDDAKQLLEAVSAEHLRKGSTMFFGSNQFNPASLISVALYAPHIHAWQDLVNIAKSPECERLRTHLINAYFDTPATPLANEQMACLWEACDVFQKRNMLSYCANELFEHHQKREPLRATRRPPLLKDFSYATQLAQQSDWSALDIVGATGSILGGAIKDEQEQFQLVNTLCDALPWHQWALYVPPLHVSPFASNITKQWIQFIEEGLDPGQDVAQWLTDLHRFANPNAPDKVDVVVSKILHSLDYLLKYAAQDTLTDEDLHALGQWKGMSQLMDVARTQNGFEAQITYYDHLMLQAHVPNCNERPATRPSKM